MGVTKMGVLLPTYGPPCGNIEPLLELVERSLGFRAQVCVCTSPDCAELLAAAGMPLVPIGLW